MTFRVAPALKAALAALAERESKPVGELLRELVIDRVEQWRQLDFEAEAHRQSLEAAAAARDPNSDEAQVMRELDAIYDEAAGEWK